MKLGTALVVVAVLAVGAAILHGQATTSALPFSVSAVPQPVATCPAPASTLDSICDTIEMGWAQSKRGAAYVSVSAPAPAPVVAIPASFACSAGTGQETLNASPTGSATYSNMKFSGCQ